MLIEKEVSCLLIVDVQARLAPAMAATRQVIDNVGILLAGRGSG